MGKKKRLPSTGRAKQTQSFEQYMLNQTIKKFQSFIEEEIKRQVDDKLVKYRSALDTLALKMLAFEEILTTKLDGVTKESLNDTYVTCEDKLEGFERTVEAKENERVRISIKTKMADQTEFQGASSVVIDNLGSGKTLGQEIEPQIIGMKTGEQKEFTFGKDGGFVANVKLNYASQKIIPIEETQK